MNEASTATAATTLEEEEISALKALQDMLHNRIMQKKGEIHECHNKVYNENLCREIETLQWVLSQSLSIRRQLGQG
jgi:SMC interacting uncharacterized protein involved in chromosome segregation